MSYIRIVYVLTIILSCLCTHLFAQTAAVAYRIKDRWGYADTLGNVLITPAYDDVYKGCLFNTALLVANKNKWGAVSRTGKIVVPLQFSTIRYLNDFLLTENIVSNIYLFGLYDASGKLLLPPEEQEINLINQRLIIAGSRGSKKRSGVALLDTKKNSVKWIIPRVHNSVYFNSKDSVFVAETDTKRIEYKMNAQYSVRKISEVSINKDDDAVEVLMDMDDNRRWGPIEEFTISLSVLDSITPTGSKTKALVKLSQSSRKKQRSVVLTDCEDIKVIKYPNDAQEISYKDQRHNKTDSWAIVRKNGKYGAYFSVPTEALIPCMYDSIDISVIPYECKRIVLKAKLNGKWGVVGLNNKPVTGFLYDEILFQDKYYYSSNYRTCFFFKRQGMAVKTGDRFNILRDSTRMASANGFDKIGPDTKDKLGMVLYDGQKKGLFREGELFSPSYTGEGTFDLILSYNYLLVAIVDANQKLLGYADRKGILYFKD
jgi:WG containing repeat